MPHIRSHEIVFTELHKLASYKRIGGIAAQVHWDEARVGRAGRLIDKKKKEKQIQILVVCSMYGCSASHGNFGGDSGKGVLSRYRMLMR